MSKVGKQPVPVSDKVSFKEEDEYYVIEGPKGKLQVLKHPKIKAELKDGSIIVTRADDTKQAKAMHGTIRQLIFNAVKGVSEGFSKTLEVVGLGYKVEAKGNRKIVLNVGFSHPVEFEAPEGIEFKVDGNKIIVTGIDKQKVGQVAANIRRIREPDSYKGKGIRYEGEYVRLKPGKQATK